MLEIEDELTMIFGKRAESSGTHLPYLAATIRSLCCQELIGYILAGKGHKGVLKDSLNVFSNASGSDGDSGTFIRSANMSNGASLFGPIKRSPSPG